MRIVWIAVLALIVMGSGCYNDKYTNLYPAAPASTTTCDTSVTISYSTDVQPIIVANCYSPGNGCHDAAGATRSGYNYTTITDLKANAQSGALMGCITWTSPYPDMPLGGSKLSSCDIEKIAKWVNEGEPNN